MLNNKGPRIEPCGTPKITLSHSLYDEFIFVPCFLFLLPIITSYFVL